MDDTQKIPILVSEKIIWSACHYTPNAFIGVLEEKVSQSLDIDALNSAYKELVSSRTSFNLVFTKEGDELRKSICPIPFYGIKIFKNKTQVQEWKQEVMDFSIGPLHGLAIYKSPWSWDKKSVLYFKFHHIIMDGMSLIYFLKDLRRLYEKTLTLKNTPPLSSDKKSYHAAMTKLLQLEGENTSKKRVFWENYTEKCNQRTSDLSTSKKIVRQTFFLPQECANAIQEFKKKHATDSFSILVGAYYKALYKTFGISKLCIRVPSAFRHHLSSTTEKRLIASFSLSFPLIIDSPDQSATEVAIESREQMKNLVKNLPLSPIPWNQNQLSSFSSVKKKHINIVMMALASRKGDGFFEFFKDFYWINPLLDITIMIKVQSKQIAIPISYNAEIFNKSEIKNLFKQVKGELLTL